MFWGASLCPTRSDDSNSARTWVLIFWFFLSSLGLNLCNFLEDKSLSCLLCRAVFKSISSFSLYFYLLSPWLQELWGCYEWRPLLPSKHVSIRTRRIMDEAQTSFESHGCRWGVIEISGCRQMSAVSAAVCCSWSLSHVRLLATPGTVVRQAPLSMGILQARILEGVACPPQGIFPTQGSNPGLLHCNGHQVRGREFKCNFCCTFTVCWWPSLLVSLNFFPFLDKHKIILFFKFSSRIKSHIFGTPWPISNTKCYFNCSVLNTVTSSLSFFLPKSHSVLLIWCLRHQATL